MQFHTDIKVLDHLSVVHLDVHIWSARRKLLPLDLKGPDLPPQNLASLGSKRICNPDDLKRFTTLKARAVTLLEQHGVRFIGGWAIPESSMEAITNELISIRDEFNDAKEEFLQIYDQSVQNWISKHPDWAEIIANSVASKDYVRSRLDFRWQMFRVASPETDTQVDNFVEDIGNLGATLFDEVARTAKDIWHRCYAGKTEITRKALSPLKALHRKLVGLSFVEPHVAPTADLIHTAFENIPKRGPINGGVLLMLQGLVSLLSNPAILAEHGQKILEGSQNPQDILQALIIGTVPVDDEEQDTFDEPDFGDTAMPPALESHGLW